VQVQVALLAPDSVYGLPTTMRDRFLQRSQDDPHLWRDKNDGEKFESKNISWVKSIEAYNGGESHY
jgi:hypothetical protein